MLTSRTSALMVLVLFLFSCTYSGNKGERLAKTYCSSCHVFPSPGLLDRETWDKGVLPEMALRMGVDFSTLPQNVDQDELREIVMSLPPNAMVTPDEWQAIREFYLSEAPDSLNVESHALPPLSSFDVAEVTLPIEGSTLLTMIQFDSARQRIFVGTRRDMLYSLDMNLKVVDEWQLDSPPSIMSFIRDQPPLIVTMGVMDPNDQKKGRVLQMTEGKEFVVLADSLKRPSHLARQDLNEDGRPDLVVSAFGNFTGALWALESTPNGYHRHRLMSLPGTRKTVIGDFDGDHLPDILALITQGDEQITLFPNRGDFRFSIRVIMKFPPVYGSSYLEVHDFNNDGHYDLLFTNGDNADYSALLKPYHGVRIFLNDGKNQFTESFFYPMHGASQARAYDFDDDGDLDIAAISFFPDFDQHPENGFVYLENVDGDFIASATPLAASGRWITMEVADLDGDSDADILLGSLTFNDGVPASLYHRWTTRNASMLVLRNKSREK